jgi:hypothetical protein
LGKNIQTAVNTKAIENCQERPGSFIIFVRMLTATLWYPTEIHHENLICLAFARGRTIDTYLPISVEVTL